MKLTLPKILTCKYFVIPVTALMLYALAGFIALPAFVRWYLPRYVQQDLHYLADLQRVRINPFFLTVEINGFSLKQADGSPLVAFARLFVDLETSSLYHRAVVLREVALDKPDIRPAVESDGTINFTKLAPASTSAPEPAKPDAKPVRLVLQGVSITEGRITAIDRRPSTPAQLSLGKIELQLRDFSTFKDHDASYAVTAMTEDGESLQWEGSFSLAPFSSTGRLSLNGVGAATLWKFVKDHTNLEQPTGRISVTTGYQLDGASSPLQVRLDGLKISVADLSLRLLHADKPIMELKKVDLEAPRFDLVARQLHVASLKVEEGAVDVRIDKTGGLNLQGIVRTPQPAEHRGRNPSSPDVVPVNAVADADRKAASPAATAAVPPAGTDLPFTMDFDAITVKGVSLALDDNSRKSPLKAGIASIDLGFKAKVETGVPGNTLSLQEISSELKAVNVRSALAPEPVFATEKLTVEGGECNLGARSLKVSRIALNSGNLEVGRDAGGSLNWLQVLEANGTTTEAAATKHPSQKDHGWKFLVKSFEIDNFSSRFSDLTTHSDKPVVSLQDFKARLSDIDGKSPIPFTLGFEVEQGGTASVSGTVNPSHPSVEAKVDVSGLVLTSLQPYIEPYVTLTIQSAAASTQGTLSYGLPGAPQKMAYEGDFGVNDLSLTDPGFKPYLRWEAAQLHKVKLTLQPDGLEVQDLKLVKPVGELIIGEDKTLNLARVLKKQQGGAVPSPPPDIPGQKNDQDAFPYKISRMQVEKGNMIFADLSLQPQFMTRIHDLNGSVTGLSSAKDAQARIEMDGGVDRYGMVKINGVIRPNDFRRSSDINLVFDNVEMKNLSPYSGKFAGRLIKSGKVSAYLKYQIHDYKMIGENKIFIDKLVLGEQADNPDAAELPLDLAIALLQDTKGRIDIGLPVTGDLNDPKFRIGPLIWKAFSSLITKAVTSPFRALGGMFGDKGETFDAVVFDPGSADLLPPEKEKLQMLADALMNRPQLRLVIQGRYSSEADDRALKDLSIRRIVSTRQGEVVDPDKDPGPLDFTDSKTQGILEDLYRERFGQDALEELEKGFSAGSVKPHAPATDQEKNGREAGVLTKIVDTLELYKIIPGGKSSEEATIWAGELAKRLAESETVADQTLLQLAGERAQAIAGELADRALISKDRVGFKAPEPNSDKDPPSAKLSLDSVQSEPTH